MKEPYDLSDPENFFVQIGARMKRLRIDRQMTQGEVAEKCGISERKYRDIEHAVRAPSMEFLFQFCMQMSTDPRSILFGSVQKVQTISSELVEKIVSVTLKEFAPEGCDIPKTARLVTYAYENALAKKTDFETELTEVRKLLG